MLIIFNGPGACGTSGLSISANNVQQQSSGPDLTINTQIPGDPGQTVVVPIAYTGNSNMISSTTFSIDFDQSLLTFDPTDADEDGVPDAIAFNVPAAFGANAT